MNRRGFLGAILAAGVAPAFVGSSILMPVRKIIEPKWSADEIASFDDPLAGWDDLSSMFAPRHGLVVGDIFTLAGVAGSFVVTGHSESELKLCTISKETLQFPFSKAELPLNLARS